MCASQWQSTFYDSKIFAKLDLDCPDPLEAVLSAADRHGAGSPLTGYSYDETALVDIPVITVLILQGGNVLLRLFGFHLALLLDDRA